jgi:hypothetical protein
MPQLRGNRTREMNTEMKTPMTAADLFVLLDREFRRRKPRECDACFVQLPYRIDAPEGYGANWEVLTLPKCKHECDSVLEEIVQEYQARYELRAS